MRKCSPPELVISGIGVIAAIGQGQTAFANALLAGNHAFTVMQRPGRQNDTAFLGAELAPLVRPEAFSQRVLRTTSFSAQVALVTLHEAWNDADLDAVDPNRIGLIVGGSNLQQRELTQIHDSYRERTSFLRPTYGLSFMDTDICGACTEQFGIRGFAYTVGGASASGHVAILQAIHMVLAGEVDVCIALGALMDLSYWECQGFRALGAMGTDRYADRPDLACRPFDRDRDGFIFGECCGAVVVERSETAERRRMKRYAYLSGWTVAMDGNRNPDPSYDGEIRVIEGALARAGLKPEDIDYVNPHGTGSMVGDETELKALGACRLSHAYINATKSVVGHGLSAAGTVEVVATLVQMQHGQLHPSRNLDHPIDTSFNWVKERPVRHVIKNALNLSMGFGGINTAICLSRQAPDSRATS